MTYPVAQIVASPDASAEVLFDFHDMDTSPDHKIWTTGPEFSLGGPTPTGDPGSYGGDDGGRIIAFTCYVMATSADAAQVYSQMARLLHRRTGWLRVQVSPFSQSLYFKTYKATPGALHFDSVMSPGDDTEAQVYSVDLTIPCDPYAYGERVTIGPLSISNKSIAVNPWHVALPAIAGDVPAPVRLRVQTSTDWSGFRPMVSTIALDGGTYDGAPIPVTFQSALAQGTGVGTWTADGSYPGGGYLPVTFSDTAAMAWRVGDYATRLPIGTYRMLVWAQRATTSATFRLRTFRTDGSAIETDPVDFDRAASSTAGFSCWVDLGIATFPAFASMDDETAQNGQSGTVIIEAQRVSGSGNLNLSLMLFVPIETPRSVDSRTYFAEFGAKGLSPTDRTAEWDEDGNYAQLITSALPSRSLVSVIPPTPTGGSPVVVPGCANMLTLVQQTNARTPADSTSTNRDVINATATVTLDYAPRWLWLAAT